MIKIDGSFDIISKMKPENCGELLLHSSW